MRLYLIDDCPVERECWDHWLRGETDWTFRLCEDFQALKLALELAEPDVCVVDFEMPYMPGPDVVRYLKHAHPAINVLVCSGWETPEYVQLAESLGAGFIPKTLDFKTRIEVIRELYDKR